MENVNDSAVAKWLHAQADFTNSTLSEIPGLQQLETEYKQAIKDVGKMIYPILNGKTGTVFTEYDPDVQTPRYYFYRKSSGKLEMLVDPDKIEPGKVFDIDEIKFSKNEKYLSVSLAEGGTENGYNKIWDVATGKFLPTDIKYTTVRFSSTSDDEIIYTKYYTNDSKNPDYYKYRKMYLHKLRDAFEKDIELIYHDKYPEMIQDGYSPVILTNLNSPYIKGVQFSLSRYLTAFTAPVSSLRDKHIKWKPLTKQEDKIGTEGLIISGNKAFFLTSKNEPGFAVRMSELPDGNFSTSKLIFRPEKDWIVKSIIETKNYILISTEKNGVESKIYAYQIKTGKLKQLPINMKGRYGISDLHPMVDEINFFVSGWAVKNGSYFTYDLNNDKITSGKLSKNIADAIDPNLEVEEIEIPSHDGVNVPVSIVYDKRYYKRDGNHRVEMTGYGSYGINMRPSYMGFEAPKLSRGFAFVIAHVRGGGEKGADWHRGGQFENKPNTWKDFIAAAEYLIQNKYTSADKLAIKGASAGGLLIGRAVTERPDLFAVAIPKVGLMNAMRVSFSGNPDGMTSEFGSINDKQAANWVYESDAMHHTKEGLKYPAQLITAGYNDPRINVWIPAKYAAAMQHKNGSDKPQLLFINFDGGHYGGNTLDKFVKDEALTLAFELWQTGHPDFQPGN